MPLGRINIIIATVNIATVITATVDSKMARKIQLKSMIDLIDLIFSFHRHEVAEREPRDASARCRTHDDK